MVTVTLAGNLRRFTGGEDEFAVEAATIGQVLRTLGERFPVLKPHLEGGVAVAVDGTIYQDAWFEPLEPGSEVCLLPKIAGG